MLMHVLKLKNNNDYIVLRIEGYEFENFKDNIEWLMLYGKVASGKRKVEGEDPTIETTDFEYLKSGHKDSFALNRILFGKQQSRICILDMKKLIIL